MELAMVLTVGMIGLAPLFGAWRARVWAEKQGLRLRAEDPADLLLAHIQM